jgi:hypothetical protein
MEEEEEEEEESTDPESNSQPASHLLHEASLHERPHTQDLTNEELRWCVVALDGSPTGDCSGAASETRKTKQK